MTSDRLTTQHPDLREGAYPLTQGGNARRLVALAGTGVRYHWPSKKWMLWRNAYCLSTHRNRWRWVDDDGEALAALADNVIRGMYEQALDLDEPDERARLLKHATRSDNVAGRNAMIRLARSVPGGSITMEEMVCNEEPEVYRHLKG